ncbi:MAG: hypothetical protein AB7F51_13990 [Pseudorhodoplanes sp.]
MSLIPAIPKPNPLARPLFTVVPWLMLASAIRFAAWSLGTTGLLLMVLSDLSVFIAFLLAARGMIEWTGGRTALGHLPFRDQIGLGWGILKRVLGLLAASWLAVALLGGRAIAPHLLMGFDGIAFDQFSRLGMAWSAVLAALVLLMLVQAEHAGKPALFAAMAEFARRAAHLVPAVIAIAVFLMALHAVQGYVRGGVRFVLHMPEVPRLVFHLIYFAFVFGFATIRLWVIVALLVYALRASYRRQGPALPAPTTGPAQG